VSAKKKQKRGIEPGELGAGIGAAVIGGGLVLLLAVALSDGQTRAARAPLQALVGIDVYADLQKGEGAGVHYVAPEDPRQHLLAPDFALPDREGRTWRLSDQRGKAVLLNFWSITCQPCIEEMPSIMELGRLVQSRDDIEVVTVSTDEGWPQVARLFGTRGRDLPMEVLFDPDKSVVRGRFGTRLYPETWIIDADGVIRVRIDGPKDWASPLVVELLDRFART
jgi:peroxiredoxin